MRFRKSDPVHNLLAAVTHWVRATGGDLVVVGGIGILHEGPNRFRICVGGLGTPPQKKPEAFTPEKEKPWPPIMPAGPAALTPDKRREE